MATHHHLLDASQVADIGQGVASQDDEVGLSAGDQRAKGVGTQEERRIARGRKERIGVGEAGLDQQLEFPDQALSRDDQLVGGLYGVALGGAFFGESMFSRATDASKAALVHLVARLKFGGFRLLDAQFTTPHLEQFGAQTLPRRIFQSLLGVALDAKSNFAALPEATRGEELVCLIETAR